MGKEKKRTTLGRSYLQEGPRLAPKLLRRPKNDTKIWRFMSLSKFLDLLARQSLFLAKLTQLRKDDPFEGSLGANRLSYLRRVMEDEVFARRELGIPEGQPFPEGLREAYDPSRTAWLNDMSAARIYVNCWHISEVESAHLWSIYTNQGEGVAIQTTVGKLAQSIGKNNTETRLAPVRYVDHTNFEMGPSFEDAAFYKRLSFAAEKELRVAHFLPLDKCLAERGEKRVFDPPTCVYLPIDCQTMIERVYISPSLGHWFAETVEAVLIRMGLSLPVTRSSLADSRIL